MLVIGHRGARHLAPGNTIASLQKAVALGVDMVEFDLRVTKDGVVVLHHDPVVSDASGDHVRIAQHTLAELRQHKPDLATFTEVLDTIGKRLPLLVEVKPGEPTAPIITIIKDYLQHGWQPEQFVFCSYSQPILLELHRTFPSVATVVIENWSSFRARRRMKELGTRRVSMLDYWLWSGFIRAMRHGGYELYSFPPKKDRLWARLLLGERTNNPRKIRRWTKAGLAGVITDYPDRFTKR